jgi:hypothetical protein
MIIRAKIIQDLISKYENEGFVLFNNTWFPLAMFYEAIKDCKGLFLCDPIVKNRDNPRASEKDFWNHMYVDHIKAIEYLGSLGYDSKILKRSLNFSITGALFISTISKCSSQNVTLSDKFVKKDNMIPFHIKSIIFLTDKVPLILLRIFKGIIDRLRQI